MKKLFLLLLVFIVSLLNTGFAESDKLPGRIEVEEKLGQKIPPDATFHDEKGNVVTMKEIIRRPAIVSLVYLNCTHNCPLLLGGLDS